MQKRLPVEHFHFPEILNGDNHHPRVMMQVFTRENVVVCGIDETIALIKTCAHNPENITIHALHDGDEVKPWETLMTIEGDLADFAHCPFGNCLPRHSGTPEPHCHQCAPHG